MRVGVTLPQFQHDAAAALAAARVADEGGLDGVFVFDHLWPLGRPDRPALASLPLLGALAAHTDHVKLGTLVARVGLVPNAVLAHAFATLARLAGERVIAGLGTGDRLSRPENEAYGVPFAPAARRLEDLADCCDRLRAAGISVWIGGRSDAVRSVAASLGVPLNLWAGDAAAVATAATAGVEVTWGGQVTGDVPALAARLDGLGRAGATWAVCAPPYGEDAAGAVGAVLEARQLLAEGGAGTFA